MIWAYVNQGFIIIIVLPSRASTSTSIRPSSPRLQYLGAPDIMNWAVATTAMTNYFSTTFCSLSGIPYIAASASIRIPDVEIHFWTQSKACWETARNWSDKYREAAHSTQRWTRCHRPSVMVLKSLGFTTVSTLVDMSFSGATQYYNTDFNFL